MPRISLSAQAEIDFDDIWFSIALSSPRAADRMLDRLAYRMSMLEDFPELGPARPELGAGARVLVEGNYLIIYRLVSDEVEVVRVMHGARDLRRLF
ncbi:MAG: plasmid stabilization system [Solirubrobacterales bacterium]|nr:plasmid stabilization system [Solirubrobacterales bacterium]MDF3011110.1 plasmid stabilization system [Burkholderiales bacterium]